MSVICDVLLDLLLDVLFDVRLTRKNLFSFIVNFFFICQIPDLSSY
jgi:hypothetical protein